MAHLVESSDLAVGTLGGTEFWADGGVLSAACGTGLGSGVTPLPAAAAAAAGLSSSADRWVEL